MMIQRAIAVWLFPGLLFASGALAHVPSGDRSAGWDGGPSFTSSAALAANTASDARASPSEGGKSAARRARPEARAKAPHPRAGSVKKKISYYGKRVAGRKTASGERYDPSALTMAHRTLPFGTRVRVTNVKNGRSVVLRVNDRGPWKKGRAADVSLAAARKLGMLKRGVVTARLQVLSRPGSTHAKNRKGGKSAHPATRRVKASSPEQEAAR